MFGDETFAGLSFADFFKDFNKPVVYISRKGRTDVTKIVVENGNMITDVISRVLRTQVEAENNINAKFITDVDVRIIRTTVTATKGQT